MTENQALKLVTKDTALNISEYTMNRGYREEAKDQFKERLEDFLRLHSLPLSYRSIGGQSACLVQTLAWLNVSHKD